MTEKRKDTNKQSPKPTKEDFKRRAPRPVDDGFRESVDTTNSTGPKTPQDKKE